MKYSGTLSVTTFQQGDTVYIIENDVPVSDTVFKTRSIVDSEDNETVMYQLANHLPKWFPEVELFVSKAAIKTFFDNLADGL